jgi:hypothetical protein
MSSNIDPRKQRILDAYGKEPETLDELARCVIKTVETQPSGRGKNVKLCKVVGFAWNLTFGDVSNSHSCPMNGVTNWCNRDKSCPSNYPGWNGRVWIRYAEEPASFSNGPLSVTLTHTGTGGGGSYNGVWKSVSTARWNRYGFKSPKNAYPEIACYSWDYRIYASDWPLIGLEIEKQQLFDKLVGNVFRHDHTFLWEDPETKIADAAFIAECAILRAKETA